MPAWNIAGANLSVGFYNEHSLTEYLRYDQLQDTIDEVLKLVRDSDKLPSYSYEAIDKKNDICCCFYCGNSTSIVDIALVRNNDHVYMICPKCANKIIGKCKYCNEPTFTFGDNPIICPACKKEKNKKNGNTI